MLADSLLVLWGRHCHEAGLEADGKLGVRLIHCIVREIRAISLGSMQ